MLNRLEPIILEKQRKVNILRNILNEDPKHKIAKILRGEIQHCLSKSFKQALQGSSLAVIAEIKRKSPSNGHLAAIPNPAALAKDYVAGGAQAISVLTEETFFGGQLKDLELVTSALKSFKTPILRKDFIIDEIQIGESIAAGAHAILCVVLSLGKDISTILNQARNLGIEVLVEVINEEELEIAIEAGAEIIGINNRDLRTFEVNPERALALVEKIPNSVVKIAASGITTPQQAQQYFQAGFNAVLIGEALVKSTNPGNFIGACHHG